MLKYILTHNPSDCCGCRACEQICTHKALHFEADEEGFLYPNLDSSLCADCGLCGKVCPMMQPEEILHKEGTAYVVQNLEQDDLKTSSSGGGFIVIAKHVLEKGGLVYGAAYQNAPVVAHERVEHVAELERLKGSKYVQSDPRDVYASVKKDLWDGRLVYFTGTPCQVAGLRLFLRKEYENLITSDLICHGTPSPRIFQNTVEHIEEKLNADFENYSFRDKRVRGWSCSSSSSSYKLRSTGKKKYVNYSMDMEAYFNAFISGHLMRMNCYQCPFANVRRCGDITLADFWGVRSKMSDFPDIHKGVSLLLINGEKGKSLFNELRNRFYVRPVSMDDAAATNANLRRPTPFSEERAKSYELAFHDYPAFVSKYYQGNYWIKNLKVQVEYSIRKSPGMFALVSKLKKMLK